MKLKGQKALITGGSTGIGKGIAEAYAAEGANLVINYLNNDKEAAVLKEALEKEHGVTVEIKEADVTDETQVEELVNFTIERLGRIDILVNSAGILTQYPFTEMPISAWDKMVAINLRGPFLMIHYTLPHMIENKFGRIINIASQLAQIGGKELAHYAASKAGVIGMTKSLAREVGVHGITVNCVAPGPIETEMISHLDPEWKKMKESELAIPRFGKVEEVAPSAVFLASQPDGNLFTGQTIGPNSGDVML
ncbi:3-oxoacyl-ACP reductase FabG [Siminovitchia acidinfaciens]|uniref:3-oxoacyl-ACP reductase FabG n=1 Tax=Siminovitchia acidinfaciens TaxID=2321395 RepID=A0A429XV50_9BACI|nr:3-oxoacyl-ACP reductase family protein [Siminovitchia acidinfaciens]RST72060.1 3-oxoacyl-ACP reductase FabG [Siminovitchia acidinfaciens]